MRYQVWKLRKQNRCTSKQSPEVLSKNWDTDGNVASMTLKWDDRSPFPFDKHDTQTEMIRAEKMDTDLTLSNNQLPATEVDKSIIVPQKVAPVNLNTAKEWLEK